MRRGGLKGWISMLAPIHLWCLASLCVGPTFHAESPQLVATERGEATPGIPWPGSAGITETITQMMSREKQEQARPPARA